MECHEARPLLAETLTGVSERWPLAHLATCAGCSTVLEELRAVDRRLLELPAILPRFVDRDLRLAARPAASRPGRTAAGLAAAAAILMTLTLLFKGSAPPPTPPPAPRVSALVARFVAAEGERRDALAIEIMNLGPDALPFLPRTPELSEIVSALQAADEVRVTVTSKEGETVRGALVTTAFKMKTSFGETTVQVAKVVSIEFGATDVVTTKEKTQLKGKILLDEFKLKTDAGEMTLKRANLASIAVDGAAGKLEKGKIEDGTAKNGVTYHVRLPAKHDPKKPAPAILILHGSNMNSKAYVETIVATWPKVAEDYVLIGINGEHKVPGGKEDNPAFNYTYVNFAGKSKYKGFPGTDRESPAQVSEALTEIKQRVSLSKVFVGGHSQGGFLTYSLLMNYPEMFAGAFPVSGGVIIQAEPAAYDKEEIRSAQRKAALAIVHGENDEAVDFSMGRSAYESFLDDGFPMVRFFTHKTAAHMFAVLPVEEAVRWLESMTSDDPAALVAFAEKQFAGKEFRDAVALAERAKAADKGGKHAAKIKALHQAIEKEAAPRAKSLEKAIAAAKDDSWVADFAAFRAEFEFSESAKPAMEAYAKLRAAHEKPGEELFYAARKDFNSDKDAEGYKKCEELVQKYYASSYYRYAKGWLKNRK